MNISLWILQVVLALHTLMGAVWKFSHSVTETMPSLGAIPEGLWILLGILEILFALSLLAPALKKFKRGPIFGALGIALEMLLFCGIHLIKAKEAFAHQVLYWLVVAALCGLVAYGRSKLIKL